jgi:hypothetical protein
LVSGGREAILAVRALDLARWYSARSRAESERIESGQYSSASASIRWYSPLARARRAW